MTTLWTATEAALATGARAAGDWQAGGVAIDSRAVAPSDLFVALSGPNFDGHDFIRAAIDRGAAAAMAARPVAGVPDDKLLLVDDTGAGLVALARHARARSRARVLAVTGSVGKTGTKEMLRLILSRHGLTHATEGNLNNHWGLPLTLARLPAEAKFAVLEMGMNHAGEIAPLSELARPDVAVITTVEAVHLEFFASTAAIADAKAEIFAGMGADGVAVLNHDNPHFDRLARAAMAQGIRHIVAFGGAFDADYRLLEATVDDDGTRVVAEIDDQPVHYRLGVPGRHWAINSLAALAAGHAVGARPSVATEALAAMAPPKGRGARQRVATSGGSFDVIDESYNASPVSVAAALAILGALSPGPGGRRIAVLGDMLELGSETAALHASLAAPVAEHGIDLVFTAGPRMAHLRDALPPERRGAHAEASEALADQVAAAVRPGDVVMVKGSAGSRTGAVVRALLARNGGGQAANGH